MNRWYTKIYFKWPHGTIKGFTINTKRWLTWHVFELIEWGRSRTQQ